MRRRRSQKIALKSLKIEYVVVLGISLDILVQQMCEKKVLWVYSHLKSEFFSDNIGQKLT